MLHDIQPHQFSNKYIQVSGIRDEDYVFYIKDNALLLKQKATDFEIPLRKDFNGLGDEGIFLFSLDNINCFLVNDCCVPDDSCYIFHDINFFRTMHQKEIAWASILALQLMNWYNLNRFCGQCGNPLTKKSDERALSCDRCGNTVYPKISPAIIVAILGRDKILLARGVNFRQGFYSLVAGYADVGESLEEAVAREVKEEVGVDVKNIRYYKSQPWPVSGSMMIGFIADADENQPLTADPKEISDAGWFTRGNLPNHPPNLSIAGEMIELFEKGIL